MPKPSTLNLKELPSNGPTYTISYISGSSVCQGSTIYQSKTGVCGDVIWNVLYNSRCFSGNSWKSVASQIGTTIQIVDYGYSSTDCSGSSIFSLSYASNLTGCAGPNNNFALSFDSQFALSEYVSETSSLTFFSMSGCTGNDLATLYGSGFCSNTDWTIVDSGSVWSGAGIRIDWLTSGFQLNFYASATCSQQPTNVWTGSSTGCYNPPTGETLYINGVSCPSVSANQ